ncbi:MAG: DNA polymerase III subunit delta' C-terminal domain-containing protein [Phycisphaerae bacterium]|jgi:DNA polymerase-3 subunit delta'|nr:DNA polymerase III subunit delta' C-terminal domain-containing protein [Phycisphaerae bacterium]
MLQLLDIVGQDAAVADLQRSLATARLPHAMMFVGPEGVGRRTTAAALAASLLCERPDRTPNNGRLPQLPQDFQLTQACGRCIDCKMMAAGTHGDFQMVHKELAKFHPDPAVRSRKMQELGIDVIRHFLIAPAGLSPTRGRGRVFVVRQADLMSIVAQNALLKTLEEPPDGTTIILICRRVDQMLPTTQSRCRPLHLGPLPRQFVVARLTESGVEPGEAEFWAAFTNGSVGRAIALADGGMYQIKRDLLEHLGRLPADGDAALGSRLAQITENLAKAAVKASRNADGSEMAKTLATRQAAAVMLELIAGAFSDAVTLATGAQRPLIHTDQRPVVENLARRLVPGRLAAVIEQLSRYEQLLWRNVSPKIVWDNVALICATGR